MVHAEGSSRLCQPTSGLLKSRCNVIAKCQHGNGKARQGDFAIEIQQDKFGPRLDRQNFHRCGGTKIAL